MKKELELVVIAWKIRIFRCVTMLIPRMNLLRRERLAITIYSFF